MPRALSAWGAVALGQDVALLLGRRRGVNLEVRSLAITNDLGAAFRAVATDTLTVVASRRAKVWTDIADLEEDEAFQIDPAALPVRPKPQRQSAAYRASFGPFGDDIPDAIARASSLGLLLANPGSADPISVAEAKKLAFTFYAVTFSTDGDDAVSFVKQHQPLRLMRGDRSFLGIMSNDVVDVSSGSILSFASDFDLIIDETNIVALRDVVKALFADLDLIAAAVPVMVARLSGFTNLKLAPGTAQAISDAVVGRRVLARRLLTVVSDPVIATLTPAKVRSYLQAERIDHSAVIKNGRLSCTEETAEALLDYLIGARGRHPYTDDVMRNEKRTKVV